jgi:outer membrane protein assembly factor BamB
MKNDIVKSIVALGMAAVITGCESTEKPAPAASTPPAASTDTKAPDTDVAVAVATDADKKDATDMGKAVAQATDAAQATVADVASKATAAVATAGPSKYDWPQWGRTKARNMYTPAKNVPMSFNPGKFKRGTEDIDMATTKNVKWVAKLGSQTYGNPTIVNGRVYIGTNNEAPRDPQHKGDRSILMCLDEKTGDLIWQLVVPKLKSGKVNDWENLGILSSAAVEGDRVYLVTSRCEVICVDANGLANGNQGMKDEAQYISGPGNKPATVGAKDADIIWVYDMMDELGVFPHNAANSSPVVIGNMVYVCTSNGQDWTHVNVPSPMSPSFIALDAKTGELKGEDDAEIGENIFHGQWTSPSAGQVGSDWQLFFGGGNGLLYGFGSNPVFDSSEDMHFLKKIWWVDTNPKARFEYKYPDPEGPNEINATPVYWNKHVYIAQGQDPEHGEGVGMLVCVDPTKKGDITKTGVVWKYEKINRSISTVSIDEETGLLFVGDFSGFVYCLDAKTGKEHWIYDMKAHMWGSTLVADGKLFVGDEDGDLVVLPAKADFNPKDKKAVLFETNMMAPIYSTPIIANGVLYVGTQSHLYAIKN